MAFWLIAETILDIATELLSDDDIDTDGDGDVDKDDVENLIERCEMFASIMGQVAQADDEVSDEEEEQAWAILNKTCFSKALNEDMLKLANLKKKQVKKRLIAKFEEPYSFKKVSKYALKNDLEEKFYELACIIVIADGVIDEEEREFLDEFAKKLDLAKFDKKSIEKKYLKIKKKK